VTKTEILWTALELLKGFERKFTQILTTVAWERCNNVFEVTGSKFKSHREVLASLALESISGLLRLFRLWTLWTA